MEGFNIEFQGAPDAPPAWLSRRRSIEHAGEPRALASFTSVFQTSMADSPQQQRECFRIRYQVYCVDHDFEDPAQHPDGAETDAYDSHSVHSLLTHRSTGRAIGTVRLLLPRAGAERRTLPIQHLAGSIAGDALAPFPIETTAEISRFAILKNIHSNHPSAGAEAEMPPQEWRKLLLQLPLGLVKACLEMSLRAGITHWAAVMEPALLRLLARHGLHMNPLGAPVPYHGLRQPCWVSLAALLNRTWQERRDVWDLLTDSGRLYPAPECAPVPSH